MRESFTSQDVVARSCRDRRIRCVVDRLHADPALRPRHLAQIVGLSTSHLQHLFKREVGISISAFAGELQLQRAKHLLQTTFLSTKEVRNAVGITAAANFSRWFKQRFGLTPSACRAAITVLTNK